MVNVEKFYVSLLRDRLDERFMTPRELSFAKGVVSFYDGRGTLTEKQLASARKLAVRLIVERDPKVLNFS